MVYAVDFDGTLCENKFPEIGEEYPKRLECLRRLKASGHKIILWTCRTERHLSEAVAWCARRGIVFDAVNENLPEVKSAWGGDTRKVYCDYYIDDKALSETYLDWR